MAGRTRDWRTTHPQDNRQDPTRLISKFTGSLKTVAKKWPQVKDASSLWLSQKGRKKLSASAIGQMISELVEECDTRLPAHTSAHALRHTFARNYLSQYPGDVVGLAALLGHSSLDTTMIYSQPSVTQLAARVEKLNSNAYA